MYIVVYLGPAYMCVAIIDNFLVELKPFDKVVSCTMHLLLIAMLACGFSATILVRGTGQPSTVNCLTIIVAVLEDQLALVENPGQDISPLGDSLPFLIFISCTSS